MESILLGSTSCDKLIFVEQMIIFVYPSHFLENF